MRITEHQKKVIIDAVKVVDSDAKIWLFGSRTDDNKRGGDIDIAIYSEKINNDIMQEIQVKHIIFDKIGEQKIDIVSSSDGKEAIFKFAVQEGILLSE